MKHVKHVKYIPPTDKYISKLLDYSGFGRKMKLRINLDQILDLHWKLANSHHTTGIGQIEATNISIHNITTETLTHTCNSNLSIKTCTIQSRHEPLCSLLPIT